MIAEIGPDVQKRQQTVLFFLTSPGSMHLGNILRSKIPMTGNACLNFSSNLQFLTILALILYSTFPLGRLLRPKLSTVGF